MSSIKTYIAANWFWIALMIIVIFGYAVGKDIALRDNARENAKQIELQH